MNYCSKLGITSVWALGVALSGNSACLAPTEPYVDTDAPTSTGDDSDPSASTSVSTTATTTTTASTTDTSMTSTTASTTVDPSTTETADSTDTDPTTGTESETDPTTGTETTGPATTGSETTETETTDPATSESTAGAPVCGDGNPEGDEECDDGNLVDHDGCDNTCVAEPFCEFFVDVECPSGATMFCDTSAITCDSSDHAISACEACVGEGASCQAFQDVGGCNEGSGVVDQDSACPGVLNFVYLGDVCNNGIITDDCGGGTLGTWCTP
jgi:cysteine-rich repeat protein